MKEPTHTVNSTEELASDAMLRKIIKQNGYSDAPVKTERAEGEFVSCLVGIGPDETVEIILTKDAFWCRIYE